jgi:putative transposase
MPLLAAAPVMVSPEQREVLEQLVRTHSTPQQLALRARIMLLAADGVGVRESAEELDVWPKTVRRWRKRWRIAADGVSVKSRTLADDASFSQLSSGAGAACSSCIRKCNLEE